jgi:DNA polymerase-1
MKTVILVDSNALAHRAFHAYPDSLSTSKGETTNAIFGYFSMLVQILTLFKPEALICVFDTPARTFRDDLYEQYKANRPSMDESLATQIPKIISTLRSANIHTLTLEGFEADDVIGSLVRSERLKGYNKIVVTGDKDLFQIFQPDTKVYLAGNPFSNSKLYDKELADLKMGFDVNKIVTFKALKGDPSDNIPGVPGVGDVTATDLVNNYADLEDIYKHLDQIKPAVSSKLLANKDLAELSQKLATIKTDVDFELNMEQFDLDHISWTSLRNSLDNFELRSLLRRVDQIANQYTTVAQPQAVVEPLQESKYIRVPVSTKEEFKVLLEDLNKSDQVAVYAENIKDIFVKPQYLGLGISGFSYLLDIGKFSDQDFKQLLEVLKPKHLWTYNAKHLKHVFATYGVSAIDFEHDLMLLEYISSFGQKKNSIENLVVDQTGQAMLFTDNVIYEQVNYIFTQVDNIIKNKLGMFLGKTYDLYQDIELPLADVLFKIERNGIKLNPVELRNLEEQLAESLLAIQKDIFKDAGEEFNISSPKQMGNILFNKLGVKGGKKNKSGGFSTNEKFLLDHIDLPIIQNILLYRELFKLKSTYTSTLIAQINPLTQRVHTNFNQAVAITGRLSSTDPNLQNIPTNSDWGLRIRRAFEPEKGKLFISFDYSQQELRLLAEFSNDQNLRRAFTKGFDIHAYTASEIFNVDIKDVTANQRRSAKTVNFGVVYGISPFGLADRLKIPTEEARSFIDSFYAKFPGVQEYFQKVVADGRKNGYVETLFGRRKNTAMLEAANYQVRMGAEREVINFPLQGSAADIMKMAMLEAYRLLEEKYNDFAIMVLQVHDELVFEVKESDLLSPKAKDFIADVKKAMNDCVKLDVPMLVEAKAGPNWAELSKITNI